MSVPQRNLLPIACLTILCGVMGITTYLLLTKVSVQGGIEELLKTFTPYPSFVVYSGVNTFPQMMAPIPRISVSTPGILMDWTGDKRREDNGNHVPYLLIRDDTLWASQRFAGAEDQIFQLNASDCSTVTGTRVTSECL